MLRGHPLVNQCCMCCCDRESVDHLLLHCPVTHTLWTFMLQAFGIHWVMPGLVAGLLSCWHQWLGKHNSNIWNLILGCLMWIVWLERNRCSFENMEKTLDKLKVLCLRSLFLSGLVVRALLILCLFQNLCFPLDYLSDFPLFCFDVCFICFLLFIIMNNLYFSFFSH